MVIPWFQRGRLALVKIRLPDEWREQSPSRAVRRSTWKPSATRPASSAIPAPRHPPRPPAGIVTEGEFDALCLGEALGELAAVVTLGSASARPAPGILGSMLAAVPWFIATDQDTAGEKAAAGWPASARRVRPPGSFKDWTEAKAGGVDLARWWQDILAGIDRPPLFTWDELARWRWGPAVGDLTPGIDRSRRPILPPDIRPSGGPGPRIGGEHPQ